MKASLLRPIVIGCGVVLGLAIFGANMLSSGFLAARQRDFQARAAAMAQRETDYARPPVGGDPIDENAAEAYRKILPQLESVAASALTPILTGGFRKYGETATADLEALCLDVRSALVERALTCTRCRWNLSPDNLYALGNEKEALTLVRCFVTEGHRLAAGGNADAALESYARGLAFASDLGTGNAAMATIAISGVRLAADSIADVAHARQDADVTRNAGRILTTFGSHLPDARLPLTRELLALENMLALGQLSPSDRPTPGTSGFLRLTGQKPDWSAAWRLRQNRPVLDLFAELIATNDRNRAQEIADTFKRMTAESETLQSIDLRQDALLRVSAIDLKSRYQTILTDLR